MTKNIQTDKINAAIDMLIESDADLSNVLGCHFQKTMAVGGKS
jgi:hypothetical protein